MINLIMKIEKLRSYETKKYHSDYIGNNRPDIMLYIQSNK